MHRAHVSWRPHERRATDQRLILLLNFDRPLGFPISLLLSNLATLIMISIPLAIMKLFLLLIWPFVIILKGTALLSKIRMHTLPSNVQSSFMPSTTPTSPFCPFCPHDKESQGHILGGCRHPPILSMILKRHGQAVALVAKALQFKLPDCLLLMDAETEDHSARTASPSWYPPAPTVTTNGTMHPTSLPDIICFPNIRSSASSNAPPQSRKQVILVDATYTDDRTVAARYSAKVLHHQAYVDNLRTQGWTVYFYPIVLTYSGCISKSFRTMLHTHCGLSHPQINPLLYTLQRHTCSYNSKLINTRKFLLRQQLLSSLPTGIG